jgi:Tol biopolymer transport system component
MNSSPYEKKEYLALAIKEEHVTVSPENKVKVHVAVMNQSLVEDYFDITVKGIPADWTTIDNPVVRVPAGGIKEVILTIEPPIIPMSRVGQYPLDIRAVSQSDPTTSAIARTFLTVAAYESRGTIGILLGSIHFSVAPGSTITIPILLQNRGLDDDSYQLSIDGLPPTWISTNSTVTRLDPSASQEIQVSIFVPRAPASRAGRKPFRIRFTSMTHPELVTEVECIMTISAFSEYSASLQPETIQAEQFGNVIIQNEGNIDTGYAVEFRSPTGAVAFEKGVPVAVTNIQPGEQQVEVQYVEIPPRETILVPAGERGVYPFRTRLRSQPFIGGEKTYPFSVAVFPTEDNKPVEIPGGMIQAGIIPVWLATATMVGLLLLCSLLAIPLLGVQNEIALTQTAQYIQTQTLLPGGTDSDADGLANDQETQLGTDPFVSDTDQDGLLDGEEVNAAKTNPIVADTDQDGIIDGEEIKRYTTNALNPDSDADLLNDGAEISAQTNPLIADTDQDGLQDGAEVSMGTDPLKPDTDNDQLMDGLENQTCPRPLVPDSDNDGFIDGRDPEPCNASNPALTATAQAGNPTPIFVPTNFPTNTPIIVPPTNIPTNVPPTNIPTAIPTFSVPTAVPTNPPARTPTPTLPANLQGITVFESNRDGNSEIYGLNISNSSLLRLTNNAAIDIQPAIAPDNVRVAYVSNQNGNNEIYVTGLDRRAPINLTNNSADDQYPTWSPDGNWIAFTTNRDGNQEIYIMRSDGSETRRLTTNPGNDFAPIWYSVPQLLGTQEWIAFTSTRDGNLEIYKIKPDGTGLTNLTKNPANDHSPTGFYGGAMLAFVTDRDGNPEIYTMTDNGGAQTNVSDNFAQDLDPSLDRNGNWIIFSSDRDGNTEIYVVGIGGGTSYNVTRNTSEDKNPDW